MLMLDAGRLEWADANANDTDNVIVERMRERLS